ncbi:MAG: ATP-binding protein [Methylovulum sp.]|uniref:sensor histidine kinase n=1 Tax=Methylovulum sp. TaxID=1916980 RepID=UPI00262A7012|nr:PAS domain-containing sensor histidine kinase [Methylovulum sp.]MDD2722537.1 ATP-binding protein [Methylovulum sp.]MDD5123065.1 ATP-binding protein [Methylovulum sp.]
MTIRYTLLMSYLLISLASALLITLMISVHLREILRLEIDNKLKSQATTIMQQIDTSLFERFENMALWSQLEVMQEIRVRDVDKRLSHFLNGLHSGYGGIYEQIFAVNQQDEAISASDMKMLGQVYPHTQPWLSISHKQHTHSLQYLDTPTTQLYFSIAIPDAFKSGELGRLYARFNWKEIVRLLDAPLPFSSKDSPTYALLVDGSGQIIATSSTLNDRKLQFARLPDILQQMTASTGPLVSTIDFLKNEEALVGYANSQGYRTFSGFGWHVLILQPSKNALTPVWNLWVAILVFLGLTLLLGVAVSFWMSARIARPIVQLAQFTRDFMQGKPVIPPLVKSSREITELSTQFSLMMIHLERSHQDLERVAKLAVIGEMAASMAHEVRTPLGILRSSAQILQREPQLSDIGREMTEFILSETQRLNGLVATMLECAKPRPPQFARHDAHEIIGHTLELLQNHAQTRHVQITTQLYAKNSQLECDKDHIIQVFLNLLLNAIQHVKEGGHVEVGSIAHGQTLEFCVRDDGAGISGANKSKVFDPFFTQRQDGIGLGLTVVQQIVLAHQGKIFITDSPYGGACFHVILPIIHQEP